MNTNVVYYNMVTDTAFRVVSKFCSLVHTKQVQLNTGRSRMGASIVTHKEELLDAMVEKGDLVRIYQPKYLLRDIAYLKSCKQL